MLTSIEARLVDVDRDAQLKLIRERLSDSRKRQAALAHAARVVLSDGVLDVSELDFLERAAAALGETRETVRRMLAETDWG
jgi:tellurite resistance protein